jgi:hypothetical protein
MLPSPQQLSNTLLVLTHVTIYKWFFQEKKSPMRWAVDAGHSAIGNKLETIAKDIAKKKRLAAEEAERLAR